MMDFCYYTLKYGLENCKKNRIGLMKFSQGVQKYVGHPVLNANEINTYIANRLESKAPFLMTRFGAVELMNLRLNDFPIYGRKKTENGLEQLCSCAGFFPNDISCMPKFCDLMKQSMKDIDVLGIWFQCFEDYYIKKYVPKTMKCAFLFNLEPWMGDIHWSSALSGKKVLVIHPFVETIRSQYLYRDFIFQGTDILPKFELFTIKAVQTAAGEIDKRFSNWFEALEWMYQEAMKIPFDVAIIGCGAYGLPLAAKLKTAGKQVIHLGGATQLLFGIKGKRWAENEVFGYVRKYFNDHWVYPNMDEKPARADKVENACYW